LSIVIAKAMPKGKKWALESIIFGQKTSDRPKWSMVLGVYRKDIWALAWG
jgi:hypothetical protein